MNQQGAHRYEDRLLEFAYGELPASEARSIEAHVKGCPRCTGALREIEGVRRQMSQLAPEPAPDAGLDSLLAYAEQAARRAAAGPAPSGGWRRWLFAAVGTASLAAVLVVVGVVANRTDTASMSPTAIQSQAAKEQAQAQAQERLRDQSVAAAPPPAAPAVAAATPPADTAAATSQPLAEGQARDLGQALGTNKEGDKLAKEAVAENEAPPPEPKVGKAVGKKEYEVQRVDVSSGLKSDEKKPLDARYRESGADRPDTMQNIVPGKGTRPVIPTTGNQELAQQGAQAADGEMMLPSDTKAGHVSGPASAPAKPSPYRKTAPPPSTASKKKAPVALEGSGGGLGSGDEGRVGSKSSAGPAAPRGGAKDDDSFDSLFGGRGAGSTSGGGTARPSAQIGTASPGSTSGAQREAELQAKQRAAAEATRREELQKLERAKTARMELDRAEETAARKDRAPEPAPAAAPAPMAQAPSSSRSRSAPQSVAMNAPPPPPAANRKVMAPSEVEDEAAPAAEPAPAQEESIPLSKAAPSRRAEAPPPSKVRTVNAQELFLAATRARPGSPEEINGLIIAINAGLSGQYRIDALHRLCTQMDSAGDSRAYDYCSEWARVDPGSAIAVKRARAADERWGPRAKAKAAKKASEPANADTAKPAAAY